MEKSTFEPTPSALDTAELILDTTLQFCDTQRRFQGIPGIERSKVGRLWATWYSGGTWESFENYVLLVTSGDDSHSWSEPFLVVQPGGTVRAFDPCLWLDPLGRLWLFWAQSMASSDRDDVFMDGRCGVWAIVTSNPDSERPDWSAPRRLCDGIMMNKPTVLASGDWLLPVSIWEPNPLFKDLGPPLYHWMAGQEGAHVVVSRDQGQSFELVGTANGMERKSFDEHMIVERRDSSLWMLVRVQNGIWESESMDRGKTWTKGRHSSIPHENSRFFIRRLLSGNLLLVRHAPPEGVSWNRSHLTAFLSDDDGLTWKGGLLLDERSKVSYPDGVQSPDGSIRVIYDWNRQTDKQILMAVFREEDVLAGSFGSAGARQKVLVNQAFGEPGPKIY